MFIILQRTKNHCRIASCTRKQWSQSRQSLSTVWIG